MKRHIPLRSCIGCWEKRIKSQLIRVVKNPTGQVSIDHTGKSPGRGAYICPQRSCWDQALKKTRLDHVFRSNVELDDRKNLVDFAAAMENTEHILDFSGLHGNGRSDL